MNYTFNYTTLSSSSPLSDAYFEEVNILQEFTYEFINDGNGNYTIQINTSNVQDSDLNQHLDFNVTVLRVGKAPQAINLTIRVFVKQASVASGGSSGGGGGGESKDSLDLLIIIASTIVISSIGAVVIIILIKKKGLSS